MAQCFSKSQNSAYSFGYTDPPTDAAGPVDLAEAHDYYGLYKEVPTAVNKMVSNILNLPIDMPDGGRCNLGIALADTAPRSPGEKPLFRDRHFAFLRERAEQVLTPAGTMVCLCSPDEVMIWRWAFGGRDGWRTVTQPYQFPLNLYNVASMQPVEEDESGLPETITVPTYALACIAYRVPPEPEDEAEKAPTPYVNRLVMGERTTRDYCLAMELFGRQPNRWLPSTTTFFGGQDQAFADRPLGH